MKRAIIVIAVSISLLAGMVVLFLTYGGHERSSAEAVYDICQRSRISNEATEMQCVQAQDTLNYEYLCQERNASPDNKCWVEKHGRDWEVDY